MDSVYVLFDYMNDVIFNLINCLTPSDAGDEKEANWFVG